MHLMRVLFCRDAASRGQTTFEEPFKGLGSRDAVDGWLS